MKNIIAATVLIFLVSIGIKAQDKGLGAGIIVGQPTGFAFKYWTNSYNALDFGLGFSLTGSSNRIHLNADYLWHNPDLIVSEEKFVVYYGPGLKIVTGNDNDATLGIRGVGGISWYFKNAPLDLFFELAPVLRVIPGTALTLDAGFGIRYFFILR